MEWDVYSLIERGKISIKDGRRILENHGIDHHKHEEKLQRYAKRFRQDNPGRELPEPFDLKSNSVPPGKLLGTVKAFIGFRDKGNFYITHQKLKEIDVHEVPAVKEALENMAHEKLRMARRAVYEGRTGDAAEMLYKFGFERGKAQQLAWWLGDREPPEVGKAIHATERLMESEDEETKDLLKQALDVLKKSK